MKEIQLGSKAEWSIFEKLFGDESHHFSLPRRWDGREFYEDLDSLLTTYQELIMDSSLNEQIYSSVHKICNYVLNVVRTYLHGYPAEAYNKLAALMNILKEQPMYADPKSIGNLYRMTKVDENINDRSRIFHAPYTVRTKIATYRYSIAGHPCLYLSDSLTLSDLETSLFSTKGKAIAARFKLCTSSKHDREEGVEPREITILELGYRPQDLAISEDKISLPNRESHNRNRVAFYKSIKCSDDNIESECSSQTYRCNAVERYILWYPLILACSYVRTNRSNPFASEYIVPQLLTQWLRYNNRGQLIGIRYFSCYSKEASILGVNYVFPSSGEPIILRDGIQQYCPQLNEAFLMTETEYLPEYKSIKQLESSLKKASCKHAFRLTHSDFADETKVQFPSGEMYIPARSFYNCSNLKTVYLTDAIVGIGNRAFHGCKSLELLRIGRKNNALPIQLETIGNGAFSGCENLKKVILPKGLKYIGTWAFCGCNGLEKLKIPSTVDFIGRGVISGCNNIRTIEVDALNQTFYSKSNCIIRRSTNTVVVGICNDEEYSTPLEITGIEDGAYSRNQHMKQLMITTGVKKIGEWAFEYCRNLEGIDFPDSIESIGAWAFQDCTKLKELHLYSKLKSIGYQAFAGCENLEMVELPNSLESLSYGIFSNCTELKSIYYHGTKKSWEKIDKDNEWDSFTEDYTLYFSNDTWVTKEELHKE